jgi:hypothetical protein
VGSGCDSLFTDFLQSQHQEFATHAFRKKGSPWVRTWEPGLGDRDAESTFPFCGVGERCMKPPI